MTASPKLRRPWLQFRLRSLLVLMAVISLWLGYQVQIVHERKSMRAWIEDHGGILDYYVLDTPFPTGYVPPTWYATMFWMYPSDLPENAIVPEYAIRLFPEATIHGTQPLSEP